MFCVEWLDSWRTCRMVAPVHLAEWRKANDKFNISGGTASKIFRRGRRLWRSPPLKLAPLRAQIQLDRTFGTKSAKNFFGPQLKGDEPWSSLVVGDERFLVIFEMASTWDTIYGLKWGTFALTTWSQRRSQWIGDVNCSKKSFAILVPPEQDVHFGRIVVHGNRWPTSCETKNSFQLAIADFSVWRVASHSRSSFSLSAIDDVTNSGPTSTPVDPFISGGSTCLIISCSYEF